MRDEDFIRETFSLAAQGLGTTWPNPLVGCVIVKNDRVIARGFHKQAGLDHAELDAIKNAAESLEGSTVYVNLEPCCHTNKRTPPCAQRLIQEKVKRVVICNVDPNPEVSGNGIKLLQDAGIEVIFGILAAEGEKLNEVFFHAQRTKRPFVTLKLATTLDGKIALPNGESKWITGDMARKHVHMRRSQHQAIAVGGETIRRDQPQLNVRLQGYAGPQPQRVIFSRSGSLPDSALENTLVYKDIEEGLADLFDKKIISLYLEGGAKLAGEFLKRGLVNRVDLYLNPSFLGAGKNALEDFGITSLEKRPHLSELETQWIDGDLFMTGKLCSQV